MSEPGDHGVSWDETVDVVCVGGSPGVLAYAICCAANDLNVLVVRPPAEPDPQAAAWFAEMTADLAPSHPEGRDFSRARVGPVPEPTGKKPKLESFVGENLRRWSAHCLHSPLGVMFTEVPGLLLPMRTEEGESITAALLGDLVGALPAWLAETARDSGLGEPQDVLTAVVVEDGRIAGVELDDGYRIAATGGLALPVGVTTAVPDTSDSDGCTVAIVGRPAGRFAVVDLLRP